MYFVKNGETGDSHVFLLKYKHCFECVFVCKDDNIKVRCTHFVL